ncbi:MAG: type VI secretion system tube protein Hcp [Myxococcaceae bacterium]|nr:type VI secretion system tube protein Hcp [Myxococcaceae bacterium]
MSILRSKTWWLAVLVALPALALEWRMTIPGVAADTTQSGVSFSPLESVQLSASAGKPGTTVGPALRDVVVGKALGASSPELLAALANKRVLAEVVLEAREAGAVLHRVTLREVEVTSVQASVTATGATSAPRLTERVTFTAAQVVQEVNDLSATGMVASTARVTWNRDGGVQ